MWVQNNRQQTRHGRQRDDNGYDGQCVVKNTFKSLKYQYNCIVNKCFFFPVDSIDNLLNKNDHTISTTEKLVLTPPEIVENMLDK